MTSWMILGAFFGGMAVYLFGFWDGARNAARKSANRQFAHNSQIYRDDGELAAATEPLRISYRMSKGSAVQSGVATFRCFTYADWSRASVQRAIRASLLAKCPGWDLIGYAALGPDDETIGKEVIP